MYYDQEDPPPDGRACNYLANFSQASFCHARVNVLTRRKQACDYGVYLTSFTQSRKIKKP